MSRVQTIIPFSSFGGTGHNRYLGIDSTQVEPSFPNTKALNAFALPRRGFLMVNATGVLPDPPALTLNWVDPGLNAGGLVGDSGVLFYEKLDFIVGFYVIQFGMGTVLTAGVDEAIDNDMPAAILVNMRSTGGGSVTAGLSILPSGI